MRSIREVPGGRVVVVVQPLPKEALAGIRNQREVSDQIAQIAGKHDVAYLDFNRRLSLDTKKYFMDSHHLNAEGVKLFNEALLVKMRERRLVD